MNVNSASPLSDISNARLVGEEKNPETPLTATELGSVWTWIIGKVGKEAAGVVIT